MNKIKSSIKHLLPTAVYKRLGQWKNQVLGRNFLHSYAQEGEDLILERIFERQKTGFYVDVGAYHPVRFSNTYRFYKRGWRGLNIEARAESIALFNKLRPRDINICAAVSDRAGELEYFRFDEPAMNTFSAELARQRERTGRWQAYPSEKLATRSLKSILKTSLPADISPDFLSIDVEGSEIDVLRSGDWQAHRPKIIVIEDLQADSLESALRTDIHNFLAAAGYIAFAKTFNSVFYHENGFMLK